MSGWKIRYTKEHLAKAVQKGRESFAIGYHGAGRGEAFVWLKQYDSTYLWLLAHEINQGKTPQEAFAEVEKKLGEYEAKREADKAAEAAEVLEP